MGLLTDRMEKRSLPLDDIEAWRAIGWRPATSSGVNVTHSNALQMTAVYACIRVLAETVASLPLITYKRRPDGGKDRASSFYLYSLLHDQPNELMTSFEYREAAMVHLTSWGNHYAEMDIDPRGRLAGLWPLNPAKMEKVERTDNTLTYHYRLPNGKMERLPGWKVWHVRGLGDGLMGLSPIALFRQAIGLGMAAERFGGAFFGNGASVGGVLQTPGVLSDTAYKRLKESWDDAHSGLDKAMRTAILEEGTTYERVGIPPEDAQFLETRKFQVNEIARIYRVPPHMIGDLDRATFSNVEQQSIDFVVHVIRPWLVRLEQAISSRLMTASERTRYFSEFLVDGLLRGDIQSRYQAYATGRQNGWFNADDIRQLENMNPLPDGQGKTYLVPLNMVDAASSQSPSPAPPQSPPEGGNRVRLRNGAEVRAGQMSAAAKRHQLEGVYRPLFADVMGRIIRREANDIGNAAARIFGKRDVEAFQAWLADFYAEHVGFVERQLRPTEEAYATQVVALAAAEVGGDSPVLTNFLNAYIETTAGRIVAKNQNRLLDVVTPPEPLPENWDALAALESELDNWRDSRADSLARDESVRANNALAIATYGALGVLRKLWITFGDNCPYCDSLAARSIALNTPFIAAGQALLPEGETVPLIPSSNVGHAPAHKGCDCMVVAG